jgi:hypothetical protein
MSIQPSNDSLSAHQSSPKQPEYQLRFGWRLCNRRNHRAKPHNLPEEVLINGAKAGAAEGPLPSLEQIKLSHARRVPEHVGGNRVFAARKGHFSSPMQAVFELPSYANISLKNCKLAAPSSSKVPLPSMESPPW